MAVRSTILIALIPLTTCALPLDIHRDSNGYVDSIQFPSGQTIRYHYDSAGRVDSKELLHFSNTNFCGTFSPGTPQFELGTLHEFSKPILQRSSFKAFLDGTFGANHERYFNYLMKVWTQLLKEDFQEEAPAPLSIRFTGASSINDLYQHIVQLLTAERDYNRKKYSPFLTPIQTSRGEPDVMKFENQISNVFRHLSSVSTCSPEVSNTLVEMMKNEQIKKLMQNLEAEDFLKWNNAAGSGMTVIYDSAIGPNITIIDPAFLRLNPMDFNKLYLLTRQKYVLGSRDKNNFYFGDPDVRLSDIGDKTFPWSGFWFTHEYAHNLQYQTFSTDPNYTEELKALQFVHLSDLAREFGIAKMIREQFIIPEDIQVEQGATFYAMDALVECLRINPSVDDPHEDG